MIYHLDSCLVAVFSILIVRVFDSIFSIIFGETAPF
jgi:hypothetical protein